MVEWRTMRTDKFLEYMKPINKQIRKGIQDIVP